MERPTASFPRPLGLEPCPASRPRARPCLWGCALAACGAALAACGPSGLPSPLLALPQVAPWEGKGRASVWPAAAKPTAPLRTEITSNIRRWDPSSDLSQCQYILRILEPWKDPWNVMSCMVMTNSQAFATKTVG